MTRRVEYSKASIVTTILTLLLIVAVGWIYPAVRPQVAWGAGIVEILLLLTVLLSLWYMPLSVTADASAVRIRRAASPAKVLRMADIAAVYPHRQTMTDVRMRVCGSGGFLGYWGWWRGHYVGRFMAYVGRWDQTILIEMKDGRKYVLSCRDSDGLADVIARHITPAAV